MITIRRPQEGDIKTLSEFYGNNPCFKSDQYDLMVAFDNHQPLGYAAILLQENNAELIGVYVNEKERGQGLGDGILRAALNYIDRKGYTWVFFKGNSNLDSFLIREGFLLLKEASLPAAWEDILPAYDAAAAYCCNIPRFFQKGCKK